MSDNETDEPLPADAKPDIEEWAGDLTYREAHLFTEGAFDGFRQVSPRYGKKVQGKVAADSWYYKGGFVIGWIIKALLLGAGASGLSGVSPAEFVELVRPFIETAG
jgi:hypothetical protein